MTLYWLEGRGVVPFKHLWIAAGSANLADGLILTALPLTAVGIGASAWEVALISTAATLAWPVLGLAAGAIVDRAPKRSLFILVNLCRTTAFGVITALVLNGDQSPLVLIVGAAFYGLAETLADTAIVATLPLVVDPRQLVPANARLEATINLANQFLGPPLAGALMGVGLWAAPSAGALLYLLAAVAAAGMVVRPTDRNTSSGDSRREHLRVRDGLVFLFGHRQQRTLTLLTAGMSLVWGAWSAVFVLYAVRPGELGVSTFGYGLLLSGMALGGVAASVAVRPLVEKLGVPVVLFLDAVGTVLLVGPAAWGWPAWAVAIGVVAAGAGSSVWRIIVATIRQRTTPPQLLGRVYSASRVIGWGALPLGSSLAGLAAAMLSVQAALQFATVVAVVIVFFFLLSWKGGSLSDRG